MLNLNTLNPQQRQAVEAVRGPVLILAGAGTGKTRVITFRIAHMIAAGIPPAQILGVTFTNKAAREMRERVNQLIPRPRRSAARRDPAAEAATRPTICTFHSLCVRILREHIEKLGYKRQFVIYDESEQLGVVRKVLSHLSAKGEKIEPGAVLSVLSRFRNAGRAGAGYIDPETRVLASLVLPRYESALRACNAVDFDDLILLTLRLFREHPDALAACRAKYGYVMVDEYQDTNGSQFELVHSLTREHRNLCVVGDDDQSVYGWRGADLSNLLDMERHFPEVKVVKLEQNYRSTNTILEAANAVIRLNLQRRGKQLWSDKGRGTRIVLRTFPNDEEEARGTVERIEHDRVTRRVPWSQQAILFRTNAQSRPLEAALRQAGVRYQLIGGQSFFDRREVRDFLAYLKTFLNPHDDTSLLRIANVPARGLSDVTMERLVAASQERKCSVFSVMRNPAVTTTFVARTRESIEAFLAFIEGTKAVLLAPGAPAAGAMQDWALRFLETTGYFNDVRRNEKNAEVAETRIRSLKEIAVTLEGRGEADQTGFDRLQTFLEEVTLDSDRESEQEDPGDVVTLITMHSCKGLEFPHVAIVGLEDGLLPHSRSREEGTLDEERRLFYVALTRAMQTLVISHCATRKKYGKPITCTPSPFLKDLPPELVEDGDETARQPVTVGTGKSLFDAMRAALQSEPDHAP